ncbi:MAG TPA: hypothetical protein VJN96_17490 [Vicinamibacterales bacterium]|nr:hypothetical protein [Vicinamibacterales bacterium]
MAASRALAIAAAAGLLLRLAFGLGYWVQQPLTRDEQEYLSLARSLAAGGGFAYDAALLEQSRDQFDRAPGYPAFLALVGGGRNVTSEVPASVKIAQSCVGAAGVLLVGWFAGQFASQRAAAIAAWIAACHPPLVAISSRAFSEALFWPMGLAAAAVLSVSVRPATARATMLAGAAGVLAAAAALVRPAMVVFIGLAAVWLAWRRWPKRVAAFALGAVLVIAPWTVRNYLHDGRVVLIAADGGVNFWIGNHPRAVGDGDLASNHDLQIAHAEFRKAHAGLSERELEPIYYGAAFDWIRSNPGRWLVLEATKLFFLIVPAGPSYSLHSARYYAASAGPYLVLLPFAFIGFWRSTARRRWIPGLWLLGGSAVVTALVLFPHERYRIPIIDPVLIVCAASGLAREPKPVSPA